MDRLGRLAHFAGFNAIAIARGWPDGTVVALYWCESLIFALSVSILVALHRKFTNKSGHYFRAETYNKSFLTTCLVCAFLKVPFLFALLGARGDVNRHSLAKGLAGAAALVLFGFVSSLAGLRDRPSPG